MSKKKYYMGILMITAVIMCMIPVTAGAAAKKSVKFTKSTSQVDVGMRYRFEAKKSGMKNSIRFSVSNTEIASIDAKTGEFLAKQCGMVTVTAVAGDRKAKKSVLIVGNEVVVSDKVYKKVCRVGKKKPYCTLDAKYIQLSGNQEGINTINAAIKQNFNQWLASRQDFIKEGKESVEGLATPGYEDRLTYNVTYNRNNMINILIEGYEFRGGMHGTPYRSNLLYNLETGEALVLSCVKTGTPEAIKQEVCDQFTVLSQKNPGMFFADGLNTIYNTAFTDMKWYLSTKGVVFYFDVYAVAPYAYGFPEATIPMN